MVLKVVNEDGSMSETVTLKARQVREIYLLLGMVANARELNDIPKFRDVGIGHNALMLTVQVQQILSRSGVHKPRENAVILNSIAPVGYVHWSAIGHLAFVSAFVKKIVNENWSPVEGFGPLQELIHELYNLSVNPDMEEYYRNMADKVYAGARRNGLFM